LWNSRDGSVPEQIVSLNGDTAKLVPQTVPIVVPDYVPAVGERILVGLTEQRAAILAAQIVASWEIDTPTALFKLFDSREDAMRGASHILRQEVPTDILVVTSGFLETLHEWRRMPSHVETAELEPCTALGWSPYSDREGRPIDTAQWDKLFCDDDYRCLAKTEVGRCLVSTIWMGLDYSLGMGPPLIFESMVLRVTKRGERWGDQCRYSTEPEALAGHARLVDRVTKQERRHTRRRGN
jgi:hypothetical protein